MKLSKRLSLFFWLCSTFVLAQSGDPEDGTEVVETFLYPIRPGQPGSLAGNMGELRTTHFHSGIDIRTNNESGYPVHASKSGYISRVSMSPSGYGNVLYVTHPDGHTTLYAHLEKFAEPLASYVLREQYHRKTFEIDLTPGAGEFKVKQGDVIGIAGNTGSSGGPHLHFDIRDPDNHALNPLLVGFPEIRDVTPPLVEKVAFVTLDKDSRINDKYGRFEFYAYRNGNSYSLGVPILAHGNIGVELLAKDKFLPRDVFHGGVNDIEMRVDGKLHFIQSIDKIDVDETRGIYTLMNYPVLKTTGKRYYKLYVDDGNALNFYGKSPTDGSISVSGNQDHKVDVLLKDAFNNSTRLTFRLRPSRPLTELKTKDAITEPYYMVYENTMVVRSSECKTPVTVFQSGQATSIEPAYNSLASQTCLIDLRSTLPDSVDACGTVLRTDFRSVVPSGVEYYYSGEWLDLEFSPESLFDTLFLNFARDTINGTFTIGREEFPVNRAIKVNMKTAGQKGQVYRKSGRSSYSFIGGERSGDRVTFYTRELGNFAFLSDETPPGIRPLAINGYRTRFKIKDELSGIRGYEATINGEWLLMHFDAKSGTIWSQPLDPSKPLKGEFVLRVFDNAGNEATYKATIE